MVDLVFTDGVRRLRSTGTGDRKKNNVLDQISRLLDQDRSNEEQEYPHGLQCTEINLNKTDRHPITGALIHGADILPEEYVKRRDRIVIAKSTSELETIPPHLHVNDGLLIHFENHTKHDIYLQDALGKLSVCPPEPDASLGELYIYHKPSGGKVTLYKFTKEDLSSSFIKPIYIPNVDMTITINSELVNFHPRLFTFANICDLMMGYLKKDQHYAGRLFAVSCPSLKSLDRLFIVYEGQIYPVKNTVSDQLTGDYLVVMESDGAKHHTNSYQITLGDTRDDYMTIYHNNKALYCYRDKEKAEKRVDAIRSQEPDLHTRSMLTTMSARIDDLLTENKQLQTLHEQERLELETKMAEAAVAAQAKLEELEKSKASAESVSKAQEVLNETLAKNVQWTKDINRHLADVAVSNSRVSSAAIGADKEELSLWKAGIGLFAAGITLIVLFGKKSLV